MNKIKNKGMYIWLMLLCSIGITYHASAQNSGKTTYTLEVPDMIVEGEPFNVTFVINAKAKGFNMESPKGLQVLYGPENGQSVRTTIINGNMTSVTNTTITYVMMADKAGEYMIPESSIHVGSATYRTSERKITVFSQKAAGRSSGGTSSSGSQGQGSDHSSADTGKINAFMKINVSKSNVYENEGFLLTYKLYTLNDFDINDVKFPDFEGFISQDLSMNKLQLKAEEYNGRVYRTVVLHKVYLFPQHSGAITIPRAKVSLAINVPVRRQMGNDPMDSFFGGFFQQMQTVNKDVYSSPLTINVKPLPSPKPNGFTGAVGEFDLKMDKPESVVKSNESYTVKLTLSGTGNLKLAQIPKPEFPNGFDLFDPKDSNDVDVTDAGMSGSKSTEFYAVPRAEGDYTIPPITFSYFNPRTASYQTVSTQPVKLHVDKGSDNTQTTVTNFTDKQNVKYLAKDIRYIKKSTDASTVMYDSHLSLYLMIYLIVIIVALVIFFILRRQLRDQVDTIGYRRRKAGKIAKRWLKLALQKRNSGDHGAYYEALLKGLSDYISGKFHIPLSSMSKEYISERLEAYGVPNDLVSSVLSLISELEMARYTPSGDVEAKDALFDRSAEVIEGLESVKIKK